MVKQIRTPKTSSATKAFLKRVQQVSSVQEYWALIQETKNKKVIEEFLNLQSFERRKELLVELANMHDEGFERFCIPRRWGFRFFQTQAALTKSIATVVIANFVGFAIEREGVACLAAGDEI